MHNVGYLPSSQSSHVSCRSSTFYKCGIGSSEACLGSCCRAEISSQTWVILKSVLFSRWDTKEDIVLSTHRVFKGDTLAECARETQIYPQAESKEQGPRPLAQWHPGHSPISWGALALQCWQNIAVIVYASLKAFWFSSFTFTSSVAHTKLST